MPSYWISARAVSGDAFTDQIDLGTTRYLRVPDGQKPSPADRIPLSTWLAEIVALFKPIAVPGHDKPIPSGDVVFMVHGYNNTVDLVTQRRQLIGDGLAKAGFPCEVVCFDWPSGDRAFAYLRDLDHARATAIRLVAAGVRPLLKALGKECDIRVHAVGHSMGCFVLREAFDHADDPMPPSNWTINQMVMFSGDVDAPSFADGDADTESMYAHVYRLTNYFSGYDEVLQISNAKRFGVEPRVGRVGLPPDAPTSAVNVDCSARFAKTYPTAVNNPLDLTLTHSWWFEDPHFMADLAIVLRGAVDREMISTRSPGPGRTQILE